MSVRFVAGRLVVLGLITVELIVAVAATWVYVAAAGRVVDADALPRESTLVVLGSLVSDGRPGDYVRGRLDTALDLYRDGRVARIVNSGNGSAGAGDEPAVMRAYLEEHGVPAAVIVDDALGIDTADTCRGLRDRFGVHRPVLITQDFHLDRAIALCRRLGVDDPVGVVAGCACPWPTVIRNHLRETFLARPRALLTAVTG
ncbi:SanA/YdcF family protein [Gordonia sp. NPDC003376]